ncbi:hypothetical protein Xkoz_03839 [Xenorhabdus kozodoii]|uniref:site-specific DNA-methyltransferase (adenine-specific) n=2 Tax=Xenorhabdus kozodoii TaxID=351676 RepID=A0A2D0KR88_9GAMM|nr:hypothetical protein Xkoz_03839 [Xenorhabdus kozodoii]
MVSHINDSHTGTVIASDRHEYLMEMWIALLSGWQPPEQISREQYYAVKSNPDETPHLTGWVGFNCSYAGKWFDGYVGSGRVKSGRVRDYQLEAINNIQRQLIKLNGVILQCCDYRELDIPDGAVVYCDPPYANTRQYRDTFNTAEFWNWVRELSRRCTVFVSEYTAPDDFDCIWSREVISGISGTKTTSIESLFMMET